MSSNKDTAVLLTMPDYLLLDEPWQTHNIGRQNPTCPTHTIAGLPTAAVNSFPLRPSVLPPFPVKPDRWLRLRLIVLVTLAVISLLAIVTISTQLVVRHTRANTNNHNNAGVDNLEIFFRGGGEDAERTVLSGGRVVEVDIDDVGRLGEHGGVTVEVDIDMNRGDEEEEEEDREDRDQFIEDHVLFYPAATLDDERAVISRDLNDELGGGMAGRLLGINTSSDLREILKPSISIE